MVSFSIPALALHVTEHKVTTHRKSQLRNVEHKSHYRLSEFCNFIKRSPKATSKALDFDISLQQSSNAFALFSTLSVLQKVPGLLLTYL
jgi:hypothetical protein